MNNGNNKQKLSEKKKIMIAIIASVVCIAAVIGMVLSTTGEVSAYNQKLKLAEQYVAEGNLDAAEIQYKELIDLDPKRETAYIELANEVYLKQDRYTEAYEILELGLRNTGKDSVFRKAKEEITEVQKNSEEWKTAYRGILEENASGIYNYEHPEYGEPREGTALCDLNGDGVDELLFFVAESFELETMHIYTYQDGKAREITYDWDSGVPDLGGESADRMQIAQVAGGADYIVYKEKGQKGFTTYSNITDEEIFCTTNRYEMDASCNTSRTALLGMWYMLVDLDNNGKFGPDYATYYKDHNKCSRDEYNEIMDPSIENIETVIFRFYDDGSDGEGEYDDHPAMWRNTKGKAISLYYEDMLSKLRVAAAETQTGSGTLADADYPETINGGMTKEETESILADVIAMGNDYEMGDEISREEIEKMFNASYSSVIVQYVELSDDYSMDGHYVIPLNNINRYRLFYGFEPYEKNKTYADGTPGCWTDDDNLYIDPAWGDSFIDSSAKITEAEYSGDSLRIKFDYSAYYRLDDITKQGVYTARFAKTSDGKYFLNSIEKE